MAHGFEASGLKRPPPLVINLIWYRFHLPTAEKVPIMKTKANLRNRKSHMKYDIECPHVSFSMSPKTLRGVKFHATSGSGVKLIPNKCSQTNPKDVPLGVLKVVGFLLAVLGK